MKRRLLCLLLVLTMLPVSSLAASDAGLAGTTTSYLNGAGLTVAAAAHTGIALGIQQMSGEQYTVKTKNYSCWKKPKKGCAKAAFVL